VGPASLAAGIGSGAGRDVRLPRRPRGRPEHHSRVLEREPPLPAGRLLCGPLRIDRRRWPQTTVPRSCASRPQDPSPPQGRIPRRTNALIMPPSGRSSGGVETHLVPSQTARPGASGQRGKALRSQRCQWCAGGSTSDSIRARLGLVVAAISAAMATSSQAAWTGIESDRLGGQIALLETWVASRTEPATVKNWAAKVIESMKRRRVSVPEEEAEGR